MMPIFTTTLSLIALVVALPSQAHSREDYLYFFKSSANKLSVVDQKRIYELMNLQRDPVTKQFIQSECPPTEFDTELKDLNHDGVMEVIISGGNTCTAGNAGSRLWVFIKSAEPAGNYQLNFGVPFGEYELLNTFNRGYPDIKLGGPGFCYGIWRWDGVRYDHFRNVPTAQDGCTSH